MSSGMIVWGRCALVGVLAVSALACGGSGIQGGAGGTTEAGAPPAAGAEAPRVEGLPAPEKGTAQLDGLYLQVYSNGASLVKNFYLFTPAGYFTRVPFGGIDPFDFAAAAKKYPTGVGTYTLTGKKITIRFANGKTDTMTYAVTKEGVEFDGYFAEKVPAFKPKSALEGKYSGELAVSGDVSSVSTARTFVFRKDGTYDVESLGAVRAKSSKTDPGQAAGSSGKDNGTYTLSGNTLTLKNSTGKTSRHTIFPYENYSKQTELVIDGMFCKPIK